MTFIIIKYSLVFTKTLIATMKNLPLAIAINLSH